jgi:hypothetical protein
MDNLEISELTLKDKFIWYRYIYAISYQEIQVFL